MKVSHEIPFAYLEQSLKFNDYDYLLPHLYDEYEEYREFFNRENHRQRRYIVMDNSLHELGVPYSKGRMISIIEEIKPDEFIVPDAWEDATTSMRQAKEWSFIELPEGVEKVAVVQGKSFSDVVKCYQTYKWLGYNKIAFSYGASYYNDICKHPNKDWGKAIGRLAVISDMITRFSGFTIGSIMTGVIWIGKPESFLDVILYDNFHVILWFGGLYFALRGNRI